VSATEPTTTGIHGGSAPTSPVATANPTPAAGPPAGAAVVSMAGSSCTSQAPNPA
jgi:hypothetical protein